MERTEAQKRADRKYKKEKAKRSYIEFYGTDTDIWEHLQRQEQFLHTVSVHFSFGLEITA